VLALAQFSSPTTSASIDSGKRKEKVLQTTTTNTNTRRKRKGNNKGKAGKEQTQGFMVAPL